MSEINEQSPYCCYINDDYEQCSNTPRWRLFGAEGPEDSTDSCEFHVIHLAPLRLTGVEELVVSS